MSDPGLTVVCPKCKNTLMLGPKICTLVLLQQHEYMSYFRVTCPLPQCDDHTWFIFADAEDPEKAHEIIRKAQEHQWPIREFASTPAHVIHDYVRAADIELVVPMDLLPRHLELVARLGVILVNTPDSELMEIFSEPPPKSDLPKRWR